MITTTKIFTCWYIKKVLKNVYAFFIKLLATAKQLIRRNSICCLKNQAIFHRVSIEMFERGLTPPLPLFVFIRSLRSPLLPPQQTQGFSQVLRTCGGGGGGLFKVWWGGIKLIHGGRMKILLKNSCGGVHLIVNLTTISLQAWKFTKNKLLHSYFWRILDRF